MESTAGSSAAVKPSKLKSRVGIALNVLPALALVASAAMKLSHNAGFAEQWVNGLGWPDSLLTPIGLLELTCVVVFVIPRTRLLGALLLTAYLGGAVATHVRAGQPFIPPLILGILIWVGLVLRDPRLPGLFAPSTKGAAS